MYQKRTESEYRKTEKEKQIKIFENECGGILRIEDIKSRRIIKDIKVFHFLKDPILNLYEKISDECLQYFSHNQIKWWKIDNKNKIRNEISYEVTPKEMPTRNILSSQITCLNHLFPIRHDRENVLGIAKIICSDFVDVLEIETDEFLPGFIQFEAVSETDHLNEVKPPKTKPPRGEFSTSVDALIYAVHKSGEKYLIPIEWKYTEEYEYSGDPVDLSIGNSGEERIRRYGELIKMSAFLNNLPSYENSVYFFEPFYQLMRQILWAEQMIKNNNSEIIKADNFIHVHVVPNENKELLEIKYKVTGKNMKESWQSCLKDKEKYKIITPNDLMKGIDGTKYADLIQYLSNRYWNDM